MILKVTLEVALKSENNQHIISPPPDLASPELSCKLTYIFTEGEISNVRPDPSSIDHL